jgi:hypothetical protein
MTKVQDIIISLNQIENLVKLLEDNPQKTFLYNQLIPVKYELQRQLQSTKKEVDID